MELKVSFFNWSAGFPVAMLNEKTAKEIGVHTKDRIIIKTSSHQKEFSTIIDTISRVVKSKELLVSSELKERLNLKKGQKVEISLANPPKSLGYIKEKLNGKRLNEKEMFSIIEDVVSNSLSEVEIALFVSANYEQGMDMSEILALIKAISDTGNKLNVKGKYVVDKHSIGGIAGNRTTPIIVAICTAAGLIMPKFSSRAITSAAGTADVIETIAKVDFSAKELKKIVKKTGGCLVWGGGLGLVPADSKIIGVEKVLGVDPEGQLLASIMAKKLAAGSKYILIDIPFGKTAKVTKSKALKLKKKFEYLGRYFNKKLRVVLTKGFEPMGEGVGPALEMRDVIRVLNSRIQGPKDLEDKSIFLAGQLLEMTKKARKGEGGDLAKQLLASGKAFQKFKEIIEAQKGKVRIPRFARYKKEIFSTKEGRVREIHNKKINSLARFAGCPVDKFAGLLISVGTGQKVDKKQRLMVIYSESKSRLEDAIDFYKKSKPIVIK